MKRQIKPVVSISIVVLLLIGFFIFNCKFSFAEAKKPEKGSVTFGASSKPAIKNSPQFDAFKNIFSDIAEQVIPTVVSVTSTKIDTIMYSDPFNQFFWGTPFEDFFGSPRRRPNQQQPEPRSDLRRSIGAGSGVIVSKEGYILTNYHVVGDADEIIVEMYDEREYEAEIVGIDSLSDVAVIKLKEEVKDLPVAFLGDSDKLRPGDWVMAIGNPFALSSTVTTGIISALGRQTGGTAYYKNYIQTDAAINPGNSGGALIDIEGNLIGINTMIVTRSGGYMGIGFAIPINMARNIMEQLIYKGKVSRGWLGVSIGDVDQNMKEALGLDSRNGVLINGVFKGQPAEKAGIKVGDVVISINGLKTKNAEALKNTVAGIIPGKKVPVEIIRNGKKMTLQVKLVSRDEKEITKMASGSTDRGEADKEEETDSSKKLGFSVSSITDEIRNQLQLKSGIKGVVVTSVDQTSNAARKGLKKYDIIKKIKVKNNNFVVINNVKTFKKATTQIKKDDSVLMYVERGGDSFFIAFKSN